MTRTLILALAFMTLAALKTPKKFKKLKHYAFVPLGEMTYHQKDGDKWLVKRDTIAPFLISKTEVSNLEYQEFLYSIRKNDEAAYYKNRPDSTVWARKLTYGAPMVEHYGNHPAYHDYPVVGVSKPQAEAYCNWLTIQLQQHFPDIKVRARLPKKNEWIRAARGASTTSYAQGDFLRNEKGFALYNYRQIGDENITLNSDSALYQVVSPNNRMIDRGQFTVPSEAYWENQFGLFNVCGNVAELVADKDLAMGGSWKTPGYDVRVESEMPNSPSADIGFRVLLEILEY